MYNRLYFYAFDEDYNDIYRILQNNGVKFFVFDRVDEVHPPFENTRETRSTYLSLKPRRKIRPAIKGGFSTATFDVVSWARGYIYKDQHIVGDRILQTLPNFRKPSPTPLDLEKFEDAKALRKVVSRLRTFMKKNWTDKDGDGIYYGPEAMRLVNEEGYSSGTLEFDNEPPTRYIYVN